MQRGQGIDALKRPTTTRFYKLCMQHILFLNVFGTYYIFGGIAGLLAPSFVIQEQPEWSSEAVNHFRSLTDSVELKIKVVDARGDIIALKGNKQQRAFAMFQLLCLCYRSGTGNLWSSGHIRPKSKFLMAR